MARQQGRHLTLEHPSCLTETAYYTLAVLPHLSTGVRSHVQRDETAILN
jgi:hypothetical protein